MAWNKVAVVGAGLIKMGELFDQSYETMAAGAFSACVESVDKGFDPSQVEAAFVATQRGTPGSAFARIARSHARWLEVPA